MFTLVSFLFSQLEKFRRNDVRTRNYCGSFYDSSLDFEIITAAYQNAHKRRILYGGSWYIDETYIKIKGKWHYFYRAVNASGHTIDFMLSKRRDKRSAKRFFSKAMEKNLCISTANIDKSGANQAALMDFISPHGFNFK
ncbi:DDE-type integrase/transposase/recombinase, partial [Wohlfahrtiimonas chitiniclastica]|nr:DDE-type integrase/transposase/recombinase [Wohlfahrtiimonas chitiniclastica]